MRSFYKDKRVLVTGASGFIGSHLSKKLVELGANVYATENIHPVSTDCKVVKCDLTNLQETLKLITYVKPEVVFHLASQALVQDGDFYDLETVKTNVMGSANLFSGLIELRNIVKLHSVIVASTDKVYGRSHSLPYTEEQPLLGTQQIYEASKNCEDVLAQAYAHSIGLPIAITRFGNVYGPGDRHLSRIIPGTITSYIKKESPVIRSSGQFYRDFIYIDDVVDGYLTLGEFRSKYNTYAPMIYNFGTGIPSRVLDVVGMISENFTNPLSPTINFTAENEIKLQYVDSTRAYEDMGWKAKVSLRQGIPQTVDWYKEHYE